MDTTRTTPLPGPDGAGRARSTTAAVWLPVLLALACLAAVVPARPASGDAVGDLQARAATLSHQLVLGQLQVDAYRQASEVAAARVAADQRDVGRLTTQIAADQQAIEERQRVVGTQAILDYVNAGSGTTGVAGALFADTSGTRAQAASEYAGLAAGSITAAIARLHTAQAALQSQQAALRQRQTQDRADEAARDQNLARATASAAALAGQQAQVTGQLAAAVAAQQQAAARAAAAAVATNVRPAAPAAVVRSAPATTSPVATIPVAAPTPSSPAPVTRPTGAPGLPSPPLPPYLQCVVQAESGGNYAIASPGGTYMGAFQFSQSTWDVAVRDAGLGYLVGVPPNAASRAEQDTAAVTLYNLAGRQPWLGDRCSA